MSTTNEAEATERFSEFADRFLKSMLDFMPPTGSGLGLHEYDGRTPDFSRAAIDNRVAELKQALQELATIDPAGFDPDTRLDYDLLHQGISSELFTRAEQRDGPAHDVLSLQRTAGSLARKGRCWK